MSPEKSKSSSWGKVIVTVLVLATTLGGVALMAWLAMD